MINSIILALSVSIDSFGIGFTYGIKNAKIGFVSKLLLALMSICLCSASFFIGDFISTILSELFTQIISSSILIILGIIVIIDPIPFDFDHSRGIDIKEAFVLGIALSLDSVCVGISSSIGGFFDFSFPLFVAIFQLVFLSVGSFFGKKIASNLKISDVFIKFISGGLLIIFGIFKMVRLF